MRRGDLWWAHLPSPSGSEHGYRRPVVIIQSDVFNESGIRTVVVLSVTSNLRLAEAPGNVLLKKQLSGLSRDSVINVSQIATIDKSRITDYVATLPDGVLERAERGLRLVLAL